MTGAAVTFDSAPAAGVINFGIGQPSADLLPVELMRAASMEFLGVAQPQELNYGERQGDARFRAVLADFLTLNYEHPAEPDELFISAGNSQALDFLCSQLSEPGDTVIVEEPTYFLAHRIFSDHGLRIVGVPVDDDGLRMDALLEQVEKHRPRMVYTIPSFHNPGGRTLSHARREQLAELSRRHDFLILADEVYQMLYYFEQPPPAFGSMLGAGNILSLGSFSKIMAPGLRLGWIQASGHLMPLLLDAGVINSGGAFNHFTSHIMRQAIEMGLQQQWLERLRVSYRSRVEAMDAALHEYLRGLAAWDRPDGGYFFWLELSPETDAEQLRQSAASFRIGFQPGSVFSCSGGLKNFMRLSFAHYREVQIREGIARLGALLSQNAT